MKMFYEMLFVTLLISVDNRNNDDDCNIHYVICQVRDQLLTATFILLSFFDSIGMYYLLLFFGENISIVLHLKFCASVDSLFD